MLQHKIDEDGRGPPLQCQLGNAEHGTPSIYMTGVCVYGLRMFVDAMHAYLSVCVCVCQCVAVGVCVCICSSMCMFVHTGFVCVCVAERETLHSPDSSSLALCPLSSLHRPS